MTATAPGFSVTQKIEESPNSIATWLSMLGQIMKPEGCMFNLFLFSAYCITKEDHSALGSNCKAHHRQYRKEGGRHRSLGAEGEDIKSYKRPQQLGKFPQCLGAVSFLGHTIQVPKLDFIRLLNLLKHNTKIHS